MNDASEQHREVLRAARALLDAGVMQEGTIHRTMACAAWASSDSEFRQMRDAAVEAGEGSEQWDHLYRRFDHAFRGDLEPWRVHNGVLLVRRPPLDVLAVGPDDEGVYKEVFLEVRDRSATAKNVSGYYKKCLFRFGLSHIAGRGTFAYHAGEDCLKILVRPEQEEHFHPDLRYLVRTKAEQGKFPDPRDVGDFYGMLRAKGYPAGREGGSSPKPHNLVPACAAWYMGAREALAAENPKERRQYLAAARARIKDHVRPLPYKVGNTLTRNVEDAKPELERLEAEIREGSPFLTPM